MRGGVRAAGSSMACKGSGVQIPSAPPGTTHHLSLLRASFARDLPESHFLHPPDHSLCWPVWQSCPFRQGSCEDVYSESMPALAG
jgi:hypothetical protein